MQAPSSQSGFGAWLKAHFGRRGDLWFIVVTLVLGWSAVIWTGFLGNPGGNDVVPFHDVAVVQVFFKYPLPLYGWFLLDYLIVMAVILFYDYPPNIQRGARSTLILTVIFAVLAGLVYLLWRNGVKLGPINEYLSHYPVLIATAANVALVAGYWILVVSSYFTRRSEIATGDDSALLEGPIGDLLAAILLSLTIAAAFFVLGIANAQHYLQWTDIGCEWDRLSGHGLGCLPSSGASPLDTLLSVNLLFIPLVYLVFVFALICIIAGIQVVNTGDIGAFIDSLWNTGVRTVERLVSLADLMRLRAFWWLFDIIGIVCFGYSAIKLLEFLNQVYQKWADAPPTIFGVYVAYLPWQTYLPLYPLALLALVTGAAALVCAIITATLRTAPKDQTFFQFLRQANLLQSYLRFGGFIAVGFCMFAGVLWTLNEVALIGVQMLHIANAPPSSGPAGDVYYAAPFVQPDPLAVASLALLIAAFILRGRARRREARDGGGAIGADAPLIAINTDQAPLAE
jgi:hypothetical protein